MKITSGINEGQVLQRLETGGAKARICGECAREGGSVFATVFQRSRPLKGWDRCKMGRTSGGTFAIELVNIPPGGPYRLELNCGKYRAVIARFFVGDVWLLAGQSNMEGVGRPEGAARPHDLIQAFSMRREWREAAEPLHIVAESPDACHNDGRQLSPEAAEHYRVTAGKGAGVGLCFARKMLKRSGVPQGLICTAHGGTSLEQWDPALKAKGGESLYGSMLLSLRATGQPIAGVLWYQGESDTSPRQAPEYTKRMQQLVAALREDLRQPLLPWVMAQIGRVVGREEFASWNSIQEQQRLLPETIKGLETVTSVDLPLDDNIHISTKGFRTLASRMARAADGLVYRNKKEAPPPRLVRIVPGGTSKGRGVEPGLGIDVVFEHVGEGLSSGSEPRGFTLHDSQGRTLTLIFKITLHHNVVRLFLGAKLPDRVFLSYGRGVDPDCNIVDSRGHALPVFGPLECRAPGALLPFVAAWQHAGVVQGARPLRKIRCVDAGDFDLVVKTASDGGFVENHAAWQGHCGHAYFWSGLELPEPMTLEFLIGFDGPFRLWLDGKPFFDDLRGANPCLPDEASKVAALKAGSHRITIGMDINHGRAWGFFLRFRRLDLSENAILAGEFAKPLYTL